MIVEESKKNERREAIALKRIDGAHGPIKDSAKYTKFIWNVGQNLLPL